MTRNTLSSKGPRKPKKGSEPGSNRTIVLVLAGFTAAAIVVIALMAVFSATGGENAESFTPNDQGLLPAGSQAPDFTAETVDGGSVSLGSGDYDATMLVFFATWCPHCQNEAPVISELEDQYEGLRVVMVGVDDVQGDTPEAVGDFVERYDISSPAVYQPSLGPEYQISGYPTVYVLDGNREVVAANAGEAPREVFEGWIEEALGA